MVRHVVSILIGVFFLALGEGRAQNVVVADSVSRTPLPNASVYDRNGKTIAMTDRKGRLPVIPATSFPITLRYIGFNHKTISYKALRRKTEQEKPDQTKTDPCETGLSETGLDNVSKPISPDTIFMSECAADLPEVYVNQRRQRILHIIAYVREHSTLSSYTDTVFLFREKMVDFMIPADNRVKFKGWSTPRVLAGNSYYRFTNSSGLDSVSDESHQHFSWSDWMGLPPDMALPQGLRHTTVATDTLHGKYSPAEIWRKEKDKVSVNLDILASPATRRWVLRLSRFFQDDLESERFNEFERLKVNYTFDNVLSDTATAPDLTRYSYSIESQGRGHNMFKFQRRDEPFYVTTDAEIYILDKELITAKEARIWRSKRFDTDEIGILEPMDAPPLDESTLLLIDRVDSLDKESVRLDRDPDKKMVYSKFGLPNPNFKIGNRLLSMFKDATGISAYKSRRKFNKEWNKFRKYRINPNPSKPTRK